MIDQMVFILNGFRGINMTRSAFEPPKSLKEDIERTLRLLAEEERMNAIQHNMKKRGLQIQARESLADQRATEELAKLTEHTARLKEEWGRGYNNDWISSMYAILAICEHMYAVIKAWDPLGRGAQRYIFDSISEIISQKIDQNNIKIDKKALPALRYHVSLDKEGKLDLGSLQTMRRSDGQEMFPNLDDQAALLAHFPDEKQREAARHHIQEQIQVLRTTLETTYKAGVIDWLDRVGYEREVAKDANGEVKLDANNHPIYTGAYVDKRDHTTKLDKERLEQLIDNKDHPEQSLNAYLTGKFEMPFEYSLNPGR